MMSLAKLYSKNKRFDEAEKQILRIIEIEPENYKYYVALATFYASTDQVDKAEKVLRGAIKQDDEDVQRYLMLTKLIAERKSVTDAESELLKMTRSKPDMYELKFALAEFYLGTKNIVKTKDILKKIIKDSSFDVNGVKARISLARIYFQEGNKSRAEALVDEVLKEYPGDNDALLLSGRISLKNKDALTAINNLRTVLKAQPKNSEASMLLASAHEMVGESLLAEDVLKKAMVANPMDLQGHLNYASYLAVKKRIDESMSIIEKALLYFKDDYSLLDLKLKLVAANNNEEEIVKVLEAMKFADSGKGEAYIKQGQYYLSKKQYSKAINEFEQALSKMNDKYQALDFIVSVHLIQNKPDIAIARINKRLENNVSDPVAYQLLGKVYNNTKDYAKARASLRKAISFSKTWSMPYMSLAKLEEDSGNIEAAIEVYKEAAVNVPNAGLVYMRLAGLYEKDKQFDDAVIIYEKALSINPDNKLVANNLASLLIENNPDQAAISRAKLITKGFDEIRQPAFKDTLGWVYVKSGENDKAVKVLEEVVNSAPKVAVFKYHLGVALYNIGDASNAKKHLLEAVESKQEFMGKQQAVKLLNQL